MKNYKLVNNEPPRKWAEFLPVGNGRLGAAFMGNVCREKVSLNEETVWGSKEQPGANPKMPEKLKKIRDLFLEGKIVEANKLGETSLNDCYTRICSYEYAGNMMVALHDADTSVNYRTEIDLLNGIATVEYDLGDSHYKREAFVSYPDDVIVYKITSSNEPLKAYISYQRENTIYTKAEANEIISVAKTISGEHKFATKIKVITDGKITANDNRLKVTDTKEIIILVQVETEFKRGEDFEKAFTIPDKDYETLKKAHTEDFSAIMKRADIQIEGDPCSEILPLNQRRKRLMWNRANDQGFFTLQWQMGRYILASSSRPGSLPANLQGIWTNDLIAAWSGDYHTNINLQENYWGAEVANLSECHTALFDYMNNYLLESGKETAKIGYGAKGCAVHHLSDIYGFTSPADGLHGIWPHGASWLSYHMWDHYTFTNDKEFLKNDAYEFIRQSSLFFLDIMVEDKNGYLVFGPSHSPENRYWITDENGEKQLCILTLSSAMDIEIIGGLLEIYIKASEILGIEDEDTKYAKYALTKMPPLVIGKHGQLCDWMEDYEEFEVGHHHMSPAFGLYPGYTISRKTPELLKAIEVMVHRRLTGKNWAGGKSGALTAGMGICWVAALYARLFKAEDAYKLIKDFSQNLTVSNLLYNDTHGFWDVFQSDGNLAYVGAFCEMLIQSHEGVILLLPTLPKLWKTGSFRGLKARGNVEVDIKWKENDIYEITIKGNGKHTVEFTDKQKTLKFTDGVNVYEITSNKLALNLNGEITLKGI